MKISYECSIKDISAYGKLIYDKSPTVKQHLKKTYYFSIPMLIIFGVAINYFESDSKLFYAWIVLGIAWLIYLPFYHKKKYLKKAIQSFEDEKYANLFGLHELTIEENYLIDRIESGQNKTEISKIEHIEVINEYAFIFIDSAMAYLIPRDKINDGNYHDFIYEIRSNLKK